MKTFTGIPLQCRMLVEAFGEEVKTFYQSADTAPVFQFEIDLFGSHRRFRDRKYIYRMENFQFRVNSLAANEQWECLLKCMTEYHQVLALRAVFTEGKSTFLKVRGDRTFSVEQVTRSGIVQVSHEGKPHFNHRIFAEYYVADYSVNRLTRGTTLQIKCRLLYGRIYLWKMIIE